MEDERWEVGHGNPKRSKKYGLKPRQFGESVLRLFEARDERLRVS